MQNHPLVDFLKPEELGNGIDPHQYKLSAANLRVLSKNSKTEGVSKDIYKLNEGIFVLTSEEKEKIPWTSSELRDIIKPFYTAKEIGPYFIRSTNLYWVLYTKSNIRTMIDSYPNVKKHLDRFSPIITSDFKPYGLHRARNQELFEDIENKGHPRILSLRKTPTPVFTLVDVPCYVGQSYYVIRSNNRDPYFLLGLANSSLIAFWLSKRGKMQGQNLQIDFEPLLATPFLKLPEENDPYQNSNPNYCKFQCLNPK